MLALVLLVCRRCEVAELRRADQEALVLGVYPLMRALAVLEQLAAGQEGANRRAGAGRQPEQQAGSVQEQQPASRGGWAPLVAAADLLPMGESPPRPTTWAGCML
jgi:hypothetical protein